MQKVRTTVAIPVELLRGVDEAVRGGRAASRNELLAAAIHHELEKIQRDVIDTELAAMAEDELYQRETRHLCSEYEHADWEAFRVAEADS